MELLPRSLNPSSHTASDETRGQPESSSGTTAQLLQTQMQGAHGAGGYGPLSPEDKYTDVGLILDMIGSRDVVLIKGSWLLKCYHERKVLPRRQDLPDEACWDMDELEDRICQYVDKEKEQEEVPQPVQLVSISHCWINTDHPDPRGEQVQEIGSALEAFFVEFPYYELAIFWCWCSFYQLPRTEDQEKAFQRSFPYMDLFYANVYFMVWILSKKPPHYAENKYAYSMRGWTTWESIVAKTLSHYPMSVTRAFGWRERKPLDLTAANITVEKNVRRKHKNHFSKYVGSGSFWVDDTVRTPSQLPIVPDLFKSIISGKHFTKGKTDLDKVISNYRDNFWDMISVMGVIALDKQDLTGQIEYLANLMKRAPKLFALSIRECEGLRDKTALQTLMHACTLCPKLKELFFKGCHINETGAKVIAEWIPLCSELQYLEVSLCDIGTNGEDALLVARDKCRLIKPDIVTGIPAPCGIRNRYLHEDRSRR